MWFRQNDDSDVTCAELAAPVVSAIGMLEDGLQILRDGVQDLERAGNDLLARGDDPHELGGRGKEDIIGHIAGVYYAMIDAEVRLKAICQALDA